MNENDISNLMSQFNKMLENNEIPEDFKNMINNFRNSSNASSCTETSNSCSSNNSSFNNTNLNNFSSHTSNSAGDFGNEIPEIDINTILKIKQIMSSINSNKQDPRANLLLSLKPYLKESRRKKVDEYVKLFSISKAFEAFGSLGGENKSNE